MEELSAVLGLCKEGASLVIMAWLVLRPRKGMRGEDPAVHPHHIRQELLSELAEIPGLAKALMHSPDAPKGDMRDTNSANCSSAADTTGNESHISTAAG